jgi:3-oxoacyl-[acyl-carrier-protein] synthase II
MTACSSSVVAMADAADQLLAGEISLALVGGADSITRLTHAGFNSLGAVDPAPCRPFDFQRAGMNLGECAAFMVLETRAHAEKRGALILCQLAGIGLSCDAHHMTAPPPDGHGAVRAMRQALREARLEPEHIDLVNAHATATPQNDQAEMHALQTVFLPRDRALAVTGTKSMTGHCLGAAGACEAVLTILSLVHQRVPPTIHSQSSILPWPLQLVQEPESAWSLRHAMSNSFAFGGNNGSVIFSL